MELMVKKTDFDNILNKVTNQLSFRLNSYYERRFNSLGLTTQGKPNGNIIPVTLTAVKYETINGEKQRIKLHLETHASVKINEHWWTKKPNYIMTIHNPEAMIKECDENGTC